MIQRSFLFTLAVLFVSACGPKPDADPNQVVVSLTNIPSQRLNYRFEPDVPEPEVTDTNAQSEDRNEGVQADFDQNRPQEVLDRTITSPNKQRVIAVYRKANDLVSEFRIDMYSSDGKLLSKVTHEEMAVHFPGTIVWSPDSSTAAFIAMYRSGKQEAAPTPPNLEPAPTPVPSETSTEGSETESADPLEAPKNVLTFRTEQIYICGSEGDNVKPLTQSEGLMYFFVEWAPDSSALVALASPFTEWRIREYQVAKTGERFVPSGRPRLIEKNGRERLLDDYPTAVHPVWSPDSAKVAVAFDKQIRIYDTVSEAPTQAAIPLRNPLLLAAKDYDEKLRKEEESNSNTNSENGESADNTNTNTANVNANANTPVPKTTLPDASTLVSFNPIIGLRWDQETILYFETGYVKSFADNEIEDRRSYLRWHRLLLSPQAMPIQ